MVGVQERFLIKSGLWWCAYGTYIKFQCFDLSYIFQGVDFIYQLLLFPFHLFSLTLNLSVISSACVHIYHVK